MMVRLPGLAIIILALVCIDQGVKYYVETHMFYHERIDLIPFFALFRTHNTGIAFSMFSGLGATPLIVMTGLVICFVLWLAWRSPPHQNFARLGFALILGGALGNLIDRVTLGYVVDYFLFHTPSWSFAIFNLADAFITVGAGLVIVEEIVEWRRGRSGDEVPPTN